MSRFKVVCILLALTCPAEAGSVSIFTDEAAFKAATTPLTPVDFNPLITNGSYEQSFPEGFTVQGMTFTPDRQYLVVRGTSIFGPAFPYGPNEGFIGVTPASDTYAFGANLGGFYALPATLTLTYTLADGTHSAFSVSNQSASFFGIVSDTPITDLVYSNANDYPILDNVSFGQVPTVPEPASLSLLVVGIAGIAGWRIRRKPAAS
jgi:hypothetical protein